LLDLVLGRWENSIGIQGIQGIRMDKTKLLCIGHRGAMGHAPENTLLSFKKALELVQPVLRRMSTMWTATLWFFMMID